MTDANASLQRSATTATELTSVLRASRESFASIVTKSPDGILVVDRAGEILYANPAAALLLSRASRDLVGSPFGFPASAGAVTEIDILRKDQQPGVAEMRMMETDWHGKEAILVSLRDISVYARLREQLREQSVTDELTGLNNRRGFLFLAEQQMKLAERTQCGLLLVFMDLDRFKQINDTFGHEVGDQALIDAALILKRTFRGSDIVARMGGDEFAVLTMATDGLGAETITRRLEDEISAHNRNAGRRYQLAFSVGVAHYDPAQSVPLDCLLKQADQLMYRHKQDKKHHGNQQTL